MNEQHSALTHPEETFGLTPKTLDQALELAKILADSDFVPKDYKGKPGNVLAAVQMGAEVGLAPMAAMQNIAVINGRPTMWGDAMLGLVKRSEVYENIREEFQEETMTAICTVKRRGESAITRTFSQVDAVKAELWQKPGPWQQYPRRMLQMRARSWALRDAFPDVLKGLYVREEIENELVDKGQAQRVDDENSQDVRREMKTKSEEVKQKALEQFKANKLQQTIEAIEQVSTLAALNKSAILIDDIQDDEDRQIAQNHWNARQAEFKKHEETNKKPES